MRLLSNPSQRWLTFDRKVDLIGIIWFLTHLCARQIGGRHGAIHLPVERLHQVGKVIIQQRLDDRRLSNPERIPIRFHAQLLDSSWSIILSSLNFSSSSMGLDVGVPDTINFLPIITWNIQSTKILVYAENPAIRRSSVLSRIISGTSLEWKILRTSFAKLTRSNGVSHPAQCRKSALLWRVTGYSTITNVVLRF